MMCRPSVQLTTLVMFVTTVIILPVMAAAIPAAAQMSMTNLSSMPLAFTENRGQWGEETLYKAEAGGATFYFCRDEVAYLFTRDTNELIEDSMLPGHDMPGIDGKFNHPRYKKEALLIKAQFVDANPNPEVIGENRLSHNCNYFYGDDPTKWRTDVPNYSAITYKDIWPGIDLKYHGDGKRMKYDFIVNPGADVSQIQIRYEGADNLAITPNGDLVAATLFGPIHENIPLIYQVIGGSEREVAGRYIIQEPGVFGFEVDDYNPSQTLVIDPELIYSTYLGSSSNDDGQDIAVDAAGNAYVTGYTSSTYFPIENPYDPSYNGAYDVFVTKLSPAGNSLAYSTFLGGSSAEYGYGIAVDDAGNAYVMGQTQSSDFPTANPYDGSFNGGHDLFVTKLSPAGNSLVYSTFLGGWTHDDGRDIAVDAAGNAYATGYTQSDDFPMANPYDASPNGSNDVFVTKLSPAGSSLVYSTYLGGSGNDYGYGIAVAATGNAYVTGNTNSLNFPTENPYDGSNNGSNDVFVTKLSPAGSSLVYSTYLGGSGNDYGNGIAVDASGNAYVTGYTQSVWDFPTENPYDASYNFGSQDAFVTKLSPGGNSLVYSTYLGGDDSDAGYGIAVDAAGNAYVTGYTSSSYFPTEDPLIPGYNLGEADVFVTEFSLAGNSLVYSTYLGGSSAEYGYGIAVDTAGNAYVTGYTQSEDFPTSGNAYDLGLSGGNDVFVTKIRSQTNSGGYPYYPGDANMINGLWPPQVIGADVTFLVNYFRGTSQACLLDGFFCSADANGDCNVIGSDVTRMVTYFRGLANITPCPDYPPAWPTPDELPDGAPSGWPNCE